jgi:predicted dehydrogenase
MKFAAIGLDHRHIYDLTENLLKAGAECAGYCPETSDPGVVEGFTKRFPHIQPRPRAALLEDKSVAFVATAAIPADRAQVALTAMRAGKDVMSDKPGVTTLDELELLEDCVRETKRIWHTCFTERFLTPSTYEALDLVRAGAIGEVVQTIGLGPHRLNAPIRPAWFWERERYGGILGDIASHQIDQFIAFTGAKEPRIELARVGSFGNRTHFQDFGEIVLGSEGPRGYVRVDWFTPDGLPTWGDGRIMVLGTEGTIELRKYVDVEGKPGTDHLFLVDRKGTRYMPCEGGRLTYFADFLADVRDRTETSMAQRHVFTVSRLTIAAQLKAEGKL